MPFSLTTTQREGEARGARYTVTRPLFALICLLFPCAIIAFAVGAPYWLGVGLAAAGGLVLLVI
jgi:hypothetical protein